MRLLTWPVLIMLAALSGAVAGAPPDSPRRDTFTSPSGFYSWWHHSKDPHVMLLYRGEWRDGASHWELIGVLDPEAGSWRWAYGDRPVDMVKAVGGGAGTGALGPTGPKPRVIDQGPVPADAGGKRPGTSREEWNRRLKQAGKPPLPDQKPKRNSDDRPPGAPSAGIDETDTGGPRGGPDGRMLTAQGDGDTPLIDGEPTSRVTREKLSRTGVVWSKVGAHGQRYLIADAGGSREVGAAEALSAIESLPTGGGGGSIPNDGSLPVVTVIGAGPARKQVLADFESHPSLAWLKGKVRVQGEDPGTWRAGADRGFVQPAPGGVVIYAQQCDGTVLWRQDDYAGGAQALAQRLRDKVPGYDPNRDPQPNRPNPWRPGPGGGPVSGWWTLPVLGLIGLVLLGCVVGAAAMFLRRQ